MFGHGGALVRQGRMGPGEDGGTARWRRRPLLRAAAGATVLGAGWVAAACATSTGGAASSTTPAAAAPQPVGNVIKLYFNTNWQGAAYNKTAMNLVQSYVDANFNTKHKGLWAYVTPSNGQGQAQAVIADSIAGAPGTPDIVEDCCSDLATYEAGNWLLPLNEYLKQDNISISLWNRGHIDALSLNGMHYALPSYDGPMVVYYRQDTLDQLGLPYPSPHWTYAEATTLWERCVSTKKGALRSGCAMEWLPSPQYLFKGWGGSLIDSSHTKCLIDSPECIAAGSWFYQGIADHALTYRNEIGGLTPAKPSNVFAMCGGWDLLPAAEQLGTSYKWDILPVPTWPKGFATFVNIDFYGMNRGSKHPHAAWELMKFIAVDPGYTRFQMRVTLIQPALLSLWSEWETTVKQVAPPLRNKALHYYKDAALSGRTYPHEFFLHSAPQADAIIGSVGSQIAARKVSVTEGFRLAAQRVNALELASANEAKASVGVAKAFPTKGPNIAVVTPGL